MISLALAVLLAGTDQSARLAAASSTCASFPLRTTGTVHYFCECQAGSQAGCVPGDDANAATGCATAATACRSWGRAVSTFNAMAAGDTVALCKGGAWSADVAAQLANPRCAPAADLRTAANTTTCDLRDYAAPWGGTAQPIVRQTVAQNLLEFWNGGTKGVRVLNLDLEGGGGGPGGTDVGQRAFALDGSNAGFLVCNDTIHGWFHAIHLNDAAAASHIDVWGNRITSNSTEGILGAASHSTFDANLFDDNGGPHTIYAAGIGVVDFSIVNNQLLRSSDLPCTGTILVVHDSFDELNIENNRIDGGRNAVGACYAIQVDSGGYDRACHYRHLTIRRNLLTRFGTGGISIAEAPGAVIEDNVIVAALDNTWAITSASEVHRAAQGDDATTDVAIRNNTVWLSTGYGISTLREGTGYVVANNAVRFTGATGTRTCFDTQLPQSAYAFVGNNACQGGASWGTTYDATAHLTDDPLFVSPPGDLSLQPTSPLLGAGDPQHASAVDFTGAPHPSRPAIGAYDLGGGSSGGGTSSGGSSSGGSSSGGSSSGGSSSGGSSSAGGGCASSAGLPGLLAGLAVLALVIRRRRTGP